MEYDFKAARKKAKTVRIINGTKYYYDEDLAQAVVDFFPRFLRHEKGALAGKPFVLAPWMEQVARKVYGWRVWKTGFRRYRTVWVEIGRKNAKTDFGGGLAIFEMIGKPVPGGEFYAIATDEDQARILWQRAYDMIHGTDDFHPLRKYFYLVKTCIWLGAVRASFRFLTGSKRGKHGKHPSAMFVDEAHEVQDDTVYRVIHQGSVQSPDYIEWMFTTAGERSGFGWQMAQKARKIRDGVIKDETFLVALYCADDDCDPFDEEQWKKANPLYDSSPTLRTYLKNEAEEAKTSPRILSFFKRYHLGLWTDKTSPWLDMGRWDACASGNRRDWQEFEKQLAGRPCYGGLDLASVTDITSLVWVFPPDDDEDMDSRDYGGKWKILCRFWVPEESIARRQGEGIEYEKWVASGALKTTSGDITDYNVIKAQILKDIETFDYQGLAFDRWNSSQMIIDLGDEIGEDETGSNRLYRFGQGYQSMNTPTRELERLVIGGLLDHGHHPVLRWMANNVCVVSDDAQNYKVSKKRSAEKIDGIVSTIMGLGLAMTPQDDDRPAGTYLDDQTELVIL